MSAWPALVRLSSRRLSELYGMRVARVYALGIAFSFCGLALLVPASARDPINGWIADALRSASWVVAGLSALSAAGDLEQRDDADGFSTLAALRGSARGQRAEARTLAAALRIALGICVPGLLVLVVGALRSGGPAVLPWFGLWTACIVGYALMLGAALSLLARACAWLLAQQGWLLLVALVLAPELLRTLGGLPLPSLPAACGSLIKLFEAWGRAGA